MPSTHAASTEVRMRVGRVNTLLILIADIVTLLNFSKRQLVFICRDISRRGYETPRAAPREVSACRNHPSGRRVRTNVGSRICAVARRRRVGKFLPQATSPRERRGFVPCLDGIVPESSALAGSAGPRRGRL